MKSLSELLGEADDLINARVGGMSKTASVSSQDDDIFKLAEELRKTPSQVKEASGPSEEDILTLTEKLAHAVAIVDTWKNLPALSQMIEFEKNALAQGYSREQISSYIEKNASAFKITSVLSE